MNYELFTFKILRCFKQTLNELTSKLNLKLVYDALVSSNNFNCEFFACFYCDNHSINCKDNKKQCLLKLTESEVRVIKCLDFEVFSEYILSMINLYLIK